MITEISRAKGITLIELIVALGIVAIISAVAIPSYQSYLIKSGRSEAITAMIEIANKQEQFYSDNGTYTINLQDLGYANKVYTTEGGLYTVQARENTNNVDVMVLPDGYELVARPVQGKRQAKDTECKVFWYNYLGRKTASPFKNSDLCWGN